MKKSEKEKKKSSTSRMIFLLVLLFCGIGALIFSRYYYAENKVAEFSRIAAASGNGACVLPGETFEIEISAQDKNKNPMKDVLVTAETGIPGSYTFKESQLRTNAGGIARFTVTAGNRIGDNYIRFFANDNHSDALEVRFVNGVKIVDSNREGQAGSVLADPVGIKLVDAAGKPRANVKVFVTASGGAVVKNSTVMTDKRGIAEVKVTLPEESGEGKIDFEISADHTQGVFRSIPVKVMAVSSWHITISVLGGLALFMLGMTMMSDGLANIAGERMKSILGYCTSNRFLALLTGAGITAVIQSSSATTVMIIGFVNAGLMTLAQSIGVIFGANIGTTITAQIIAFDVGAIALPAIVVGLVMRFIKRGKVPEVGLTILGFGLLFFGMNLMSAEMKLLADFPTFRSFFTMLECAPIDGMMPWGRVAGAILVGLVSTLIMQSSSATTGVVVVLGAGGLIDLYTAVALILGANVGTTITAQLAAIPANQLARQAAMAHTLFNVLGVVFVLLSFLILWPGTKVPAFFYIVNSCTEGNAFAAHPENMARHIANAHTLFNIATALILLPFTGLLARVCQRLLPISAAKIHFQYLEPHLLDSPALALRQSTVAIGKMLKKSWKMVDSAVRSNFINGKVNQNRMEKFLSREERVDRYQTEIMEYLSQVMRRKLSPQQAETIPLLMHCTNDAERIADRAENIITLTRRMEAEELKLSKSAIDELEIIFTELSKQTVFALNALEFSEEEWSQRAIKAEELINELASQSEEAHIKRIRTGKCTAPTGIIYVELLAELIAISRHLSNIAERAV